MPERYEVNSRGTAPVSEAFNPTLKGSKPLRVNHSVEYLLVMQVRAFRITPVSL